MALLNKINVKGTEYPIVTDDGYYQEMSVGGAEQLISTVFVEDEVPYNFRTTGGSADVGNRKTEKIIGGTVAWNQLIATVNKTQDVTPTETNWQLRNIQSSIFTAGHVYLSSLKATVPTNGEWRVRYPSVSISYTTSAQTIFKYSAGEPNQFSIQTLETQGTDAFSFDNIMVIDLTQMFGSTIADYIYSLETSRAGAGVAWFKKLFPKPYYAYNAGELMSVKALRHITRGFNAFDKSGASVGDIATDGTVRPSITGYRVSDYIPVVAGAIYYFKDVRNLGDGYSFAIYDADKSFVKATGIFASGGNTHASGLYTIPAGIAFVRVVTPADKLASCCVNLHWDGERDGEYEEYEEHVYELDPDLELRGIPKLSAGNDLYYDGDEYESDGTVTRKYGIVDLGTLNWSYQDADAYFTVVITGKKYGNKNCVMANYTNAGDVAIADMPDKSVRGASSSNRIYIKDSTYTSSATFKTAMSGVYLVYELDSPTEESADPFTSPQAIDDFGTEEYVDAGVAAETRDVAIPVGHFSEYMNNLRAKLEMAPDSPENDGYYVVYHHDGINEYTPLIIPQELPDMPTEDGTYTLKCTVASGTATLSFEEVTE